MPRVVRIGTRESQLAMWQANFVKAQIERLGVKTEIVPIKSDGEANLVSPLYELGVQGIFTKTLDIALLDNRIDIAVHSLKDVPTGIPKGLLLAATPQRGNYNDIIIKKDNASLIYDNSLVIASSSLRRRAQWLHKYPHHSFVSIRGNINSRIEKLTTTTEFDATIMAQAGIERIHLTVPSFAVLDWMLPAPSQGALGVVCREGDNDIIEICSAFHDTETYECTNAERMFLRTLMGGCTMPIAALAKISNGKMHFKGNILSIDGSKKVEVEFEEDLSDGATIGVKAAQELLQNGAEEILATFKR